MTETVLGATWMLHHDVIFDLEAKKLGIVDATCPEFRVEKRPAVLLGIRLGGLQAQGGSPLKLAV